MIFADPATRSWVRTSGTEANWAPEPTGMFHGEFDENGHKKGFRPDEVVVPPAGAVVVVGAAVGAVAWAGAVVWGGAVVVGEVDGWRVAGTTGGAGAACNAGAAPSEHDVRRTRKRGTSARPRLRGRLQPAERRGLRPGMRVPDKGFVVVRMLRISTLRAQPEPKYRAEWPRGRPSSEGEKPRKP